MNIVPASHAAGTPSAARSAWQSVSDPTQPFIDLLNGRTDRCDPLVGHAYSFSERGVLDPMHPFASTAGGQLEPANPAGTREPSKVLMTLVQSEDYLTALRRTPAAVDASSAEVRGGMSACASRAPAARDDRLSPPCLTPLQAFAAWRSSLQDAVRAEAHSARFVGHPRASARPPIAAHVVAFGAALQIVGRADGVSLDAVRALRGTIVLWMSELGLRSAHLIVNGLELSTADQDGGFYGTSASHQQPGS